ncbi:ataxin-10-like isoform X3 [Biomphalaria glabrata]|uniref:Ataxin-10 n=1 Tax=Biomphalaria glabrata TaxID=6526 RepID=A0A9W3A5R5_BIOGL|nr:ataxin-10-like isoform X3 [Biomphalaria glabrata]
MDEIDLLSLAESIARSCNLNDWDKAKQLLKKIITDESGLKNVSQGLFLQCMNEILKNLSEKINHSDDNILQPVQECAAECFRCLRQACALNSQIQSGLSSFMDILENTKIITEKIISVDAQKDSENVLKCAIQFLGNACVSNATNQKAIWELFINQFRSFLHHADSKVCDYTCMLVHTCLTTVAKIDQCLLNNASAQDIVLTCIEATAQKDIEWGLYVLEDMLKNDLFLPKLYWKMGHKERLLTMEVMLAEMIDLPEDCSGGQAELDPSQLAISQANLSFIADDVKKECNLILKLKSPETTDQEMALVIAKELELLSIAAQHQTIYPSIQQDTELLVCAINLLRSINDIGKSGGNVFSREEKASGVDSIDPHHPVYGLKKDLIRLIANMAYKHRANQDLVRSLDGIPLLLDLTMIDCHNPFITQWVVLAIRNLVENNRENRDVLSGMSLQGMAGHIAALREAGIHTELRGGKIVVKPVDG